MNCEEVKISLNDYIDEILKSEDKKEVETHLQKCGNCMAEYKRLLKFFESLKEIPFTIDIPSDLVAKLTSELIAESLQDKSEVKPSINVRKIKNEQLKQEKQLKKSRGATRKSKITRSIATGYIAQILPRNAGLTFKKTLLGLLPIFFITISYMLYDFSLINSPWKVRGVNGTYLVNGIEDYTGFWNKGEVITTKEKVSAIVNVPNTGKLEIKPNSTVILEQAKDGSNRINIKNGSVRISNSSIMPDLVISINEFTVYNRGGKINIDLLNRKGKVFVEYGFAEVSFMGQNHFIGEGYICELNSKNSVGIPYRSDVDDSLKSFISQIEFQKESNINMQKIIEKARNKDMLTLLELILRVNHSQRGVLFQAIANHFPPPGGVTYDGIMRLDKQMLENWWFEIEWQI